MSLEKLIVPCCNYPTLDVVSKLHARRTEHSLYVTLYNIETHENRVYILCRGANNKNRLVLVHSLPSMSCDDANFVAVGSKIFLLGKASREIKSIDCRYHTVKTLSSFPGNKTVAGIIDKKIYVIDQEVDYETGDVTDMDLMVFDTETLMWEPEMNLTVPEQFKRISSSRCVVVGDKIYMRSEDDDTTFVYTLKERKWEIDEMMSFERNWEDLDEIMSDDKPWEDAFVVDDILYYHDHSKNKLRAYDPKQRCWTVVKGLAEFLDKGAYSWMSCGGKLAVFFRKVASATLKTEIWCAEIALERRQGGEIWGQVEWCDVVMDGPFIPVESVAVMV